MIFIAYLRANGALTEIAEKQVANTVGLLEQGATIPFISRYRKETTGGLDEIQIAQIKELYEKCKLLISRKETILNTIEEQGKLNEELKERITTCWSANELEDIYLPYKPKRRTKAEMARERGLEPLAKMLMKQSAMDVERAAEQFVGKEVESVKSALQGARDIIAEWVNESEHARNGIRNIFAKEAVLVAKVVKKREEEAINYRDYFDFSEKLARCSSHRILAIRRGEKEGLLSVSITIDDEWAITQLERMFVRGNNETTEHIEQAVADAYKRLLKPSIETEFAATSKERADVEAIRIFADNLHQLLLAAPLGQKRVLGIDPGFRSGCKVVCLDAQGALLHNENIYPHAPQNDYQKAVRTLQKMVEAYKIEAIAIGNGTASRETEQLVQNISFDRTVQLFVVSENGASVYSASKIARDEFPTYDVTVRGAVSIGRRLMDPLAELVKIDPKSIGVGQYQHDVDQTKLKESLTQTVERVVNHVGVDVNTASQHLLTYISGLGAALAQNIVNYRSENGPFTSRKELMKVPKMGAKTFEQAAGFLRVSQAKHPLDNSAVHPESYAVVEQMAKDSNCTIADLIAQKELRAQIDLRRYITPERGLPTLQDIMQELEKPGRDPRRQIEQFSFAPNIKKLEDVQLGMKLPGIVTNLTNFGAFVDIGIKENGLVHISKMATRFISSPTQVLHIHQQLEATVIGIDMERRRIQLSLIE